MWFQFNNDQGWVRRPSDLLLFQTFHPRHRHLGRLLQVIVALETKDDESARFNLSFLITNQHFISRRPRASLPRIHLFRGLITLLLALFLVAFWLFYGVRWANFLLPLSWFDFTWYVQYRIIWEFVLSAGWWNSGENFNTPTSSDMLPPS